MNRLLILLMGITFVGCVTAKDGGRNQYKYENEMVQCVEDKFNTLGFDIVSEFDSFEKYLIRTKVLEDASGKSYYKFYEKLVKTNKIDLIGMYKVDSVIIDNYQILRDCYHSQWSNNSKEYLKSKPSKLQLAMDSLMEIDGHGVSMIAKTIISVLDSDDFENEYYKILMLQSTYLIENDDMKRRERDALPNIVIQILPDEQISINGEDIDFGKFKEKMNLEINKFTDEEKKIHLVKLNIEPSVKMGIVTEVKDIIREMGSLRIHYKALESRTSNEN